MKLKLIVLVLSIFLLPSVIARQLEIQGMADNLVVRIELLDATSADSADCEVDAEPLVCISLQDNYGKQLITQAAGEPDEQLLAIKGDAVAYNNQDYVIINDVNFDDIPDIAIKDGSETHNRNSGYSQYLANTQGGFVFNAALTELIHSSDGLFEVNKASQTLVTTMMNSLDWYETRVYKMVKNTPVEIHSEIQEYFDSFYYRQIEKTLHNGDTKLSVTYSYPDSNADETEFTHPLLSFNLLDNNKKVVVLEANGIVDYLLINAENHVEYSALLAAKHALPWQMEYLKHTHVIRNEGETPEFIYQSGNVSVTLGNTQYRIIDDGHRLGVEVTQGNKVTFILGDPKTKQGNLAILVKGKFSNLKQG